MMEAVTLCAQLEAAEVASAKTCVALPLCAQLWLCRNMVKVPSLAVPQLASCASPARAWWLWAARHTQARGRTTGRPATASGVQASCLQSR